MNTLLTINRLPPEVLALIPYFLDSYKDLVNTTHVCRHWRSTFIASPPLWSCLDSDAMHEDLVAAYVDRCGATPLDVTFSLDLETEPFLEKLAPRSAHIRKIYFPHLPWQQITEISDGFDVPLPMLREADVRVTHSDQELPPFKRPFLAGATNLVSLRLSDLNWHSGTLIPFVIPTLTHLELQFHDHRVPSVRELLDLFRNSPLLEDIRIDAITVETLEENSSFQPVDLPCLGKILLIWPRVQSQLALLAQINYPPTCSVSIYAQSTSTFTQRPQNAFPKSWKAFSLPYLSSVTLRVKREEESTECTVIVTGPDGASILISHSQDATKLIFDDTDLLRDQIRDQDDDYVFSSAISLVRELPLHRIQEVILEGLNADQMLRPGWFEIEIPPDLVKLIRSDLPNLRKLSLIRTCVSELLRIIAPSPPPPLTYIADLFEDGDTSDSNLPCPTLKVLEMRHPDWIPPRHCPEIFALVKAREYAKVPFERVCFRSLSVPLSMVKGISLYVDDVDIQSCHCPDCVRLYADRVLYRSLRG